MPNGDDLESQVRGMSPWELYNYKRELVLKVKGMRPENRDAFLSRIETIPELSDISSGMARLPPTQPQPLAPTVTQPRPPAVTEPEMGDIPLWQKGLETAFYPFTAFGAMHRENIKALTETAKLYKEDPWAAATRELEWESPIETLKGIAPSGEVYKEFQEAPTGEQLLYEAPLWMTIPSAIGLRGGLAAAAARPGLAGIAPKVARAGLAPLAAVEAAPGKVLGKIAKKITKPAKDIIPEGLITEAQIGKMFELGRKKLIVTEALKPKPQFRNLLIGMTGKHGTKASTKSLIRDLTQEEAASMIEALGRLEVKFGKPPKIPTTAGLITEDFAKKIPLLQEIGILEKVRPSRQVFEKMGLRKEVWEPAFEAEVKIYEDLVAFRRELARIEGLVGKSAERRRAVFQALENPGKAIELSKDEAEAVKWFKGYFDEWANKLKLPIEKRRQHYITHTFEAEIERMLKGKYPLDPDLIKAMDFITPKKVFNPYLEKRLGQKIGLIEDPFQAASAYEARALKVYHYEPLIQKIRVFQKYLPPNSAKYLRDYIIRITQRPLTLDRELNQTIKEFAKGIEHLPLGKELAGVLSRGNVGGQAAYNYTSLLYFLWLGFKPTSAIRNLSQHCLALAEVGPINFARGLALRLTREGKEALTENLVLRSRSQALLPGIDASFASKWGDKIREVSLKMFRSADRQNVSDAFLGGYAEAKALYPKAPKSMWIARGNEVAADTQYIYTRLGGASWSQPALGRVLSPLTTWPENWLELIGRWSAGKTSYVFREYAEATGTKLVEPMSPLLKRKALLLYLTLVGAAYAVEHETRFRASEYTGWTSMRYLVNIAKGELPALSLPGAVAEVIGGGLTGNTRMVKSGWNKLRPDNVMGIIRQFKNVAQGKTDWLSLFLYLNPDETPGQRKTRENKQIEDEVWAKYPSDLRSISEKIKELEKTDMQAARKLQMQHPQILAARRQIALEKSRLKQQEELEGRRRQMEGR